MGTNFYGTRYTLGAATTTHIGKRSGTQNGLEFAWAIRPIDVLGIQAQGFDAIEDEYGRQLTAQQFRDVADACSWKYLIGVEFS